jgi:hypothetical protein
VVASIGEAITDDYYSAAGPVGCFVKVASEQEVVSQHLIGSGKYGYTSLNVKLPSSVSLRLEPAKVRTPLQRPLNELPSGSHCSRELQSDMITLQGNAIACQEECHYKENTVKGRELGAWGRSTILTAGAGIAFRLTGEHSDEGINLTPSHMHVLTKSPDVRLDISGSLPLYSFRKVDRSKNYASSDDDRQDQMWNFSIAIAMATFIYEGPEHSTMCSLKLLRLSTEVKEMYYSKTCVRRVRTLHLIGPSLLSHSQPRSHAIDNVTSGLR